MEVDRNTRFLGEVGPPVEPVEGPSGEVNEIWNHNRLSEEHPLLNALIMENVFKHLESSVTVQDLKNFRAVCSLWNELTLKTWRSKATIRLGPPMMSVETRRTPPQSTSFLPVNQFIAMAQEPSCPYQFGKKSFTKFSLHRINFGSTPDCLKVSINKRGGNRTCNLWVLFDALGIQLESFKFEECIFPGDRLDIFEDMFTTKLSKVKKLTLKRNQMIPAKSVIQEDHQRNSVRMEGYTPRNPELRILEMEGSSPMEIFVMLMDCPSLETWRIKDIPSHEYCTFMILQTLRHTRGPHQPSKIKELDVMNSNFLSRSTWLSIVPHLRHLNIPLESFSLSLEPFESYRDRDGYKPESVKDIKNILVPVLHHYQESLKVLKVCRPPVFHACSVLNPFDGVKMGALTELHLWGNILDSFAFLASTPSLEVLHVNFSCVQKADLLKILYFPGDDGSELEKFRERYQPHSEDLLEMTSFEIQRSIHLEHMHSLSLDCPISPKTVEVLATWAPNLKTFQSNFMAKELQAVFQWMRTLEELVVLPLSEFDEKALTGSTGVGTINSENNITALKRLKRFQMEGFCRGTCFITEHSVKNAFLKMASLESLKVCVSETFSEALENALRNHLNHLTLTRQSRYHHDASDRECCRHVAFMRNVLGQEVKD